MPAAGDALVGTQWFVFAAIPSEPVKDLRFSTGWTMYIDLPVARTTASGWTVAVAPVPGHVDLVWATRDDPGQRAGEAVPFWRPGTF
jgi:hypothetical protein